MIKVDVFIQEKKWKKYIANPQKYLKNRTNKIRNLIPLLKNKKIVFSILLAGNMEIKKLNKKFRKKNKQNRAKTIVKPIKTDKIEPTLL